MRPFLSDLVTFLCVKVLCVVVYCCVWACVQHIYILFWKCINISHFFHQEFFLCDVWKNCQHGTRWVYGHLLCCVVLCMCIHSIAIIPTGLSTPVEMKLKLISILVHMHHDLHSASQVSHFTTELWPSTVSFSLLRLANFVSSCYHRMLLWHLCVSSYRP